MNGIVLALAASQPKEMLDAGKTAAGTLSQTQWGAIVVILFIILILLGGLIWKAKNDHLKDKDRMHSLLNDQAKEAIALTVTMSNMCKVVNERIESIDEKADKRFSVLENKTDEKAAALEKKTDERFAALEGRMKNGFERACRAIDAHVMSCPSADKAEYMSRRGGS